MSEESILEVAVRELRRLRGLAEGALEQIDDAAFFAADREGDNSPAVLVKHVAGNMRSRWRDFLTTDGEKPDRHRDGEFVLEEDDTRASLMSRWRDAWQILFDALEPLATEDLARTVTIRGEPLSVLQAVLRQLSHYAYHVGQIVQLAKSRAGEEWKSLSIPRGESARFNQRPARYLDSPSGQPGERTPSEDA